MWNSSARIEKNDGKNPEEKGEFVLEGNVTEQGIIKFFMYDMAGQALIDERNKLTEDNTLDLISFSSSRKRASIVVKHNGGVRVYCKGAPDMLFELTTKAVDGDGSVVDFDGTVSDSDARRFNEEAVTGASNRALYEFTVKSFAN